MGWENLDLVLDAFETDPAPSSLPPGSLSAISNVDFYTGHARALGNLAPARAMTQTPVAMQGYSDPAAAYVGLFGTLMQAWTPADTLVDIAPATGLTGAPYWDTTNFGKWLVATNDTVGQVPHAISTTLTGTGGKLAPLPGWPTTWECTVIGTHRNVLWAADTIESGVAYPHRVRWSASAPTDSLPATWVPAASNDAGQADLEIASGRINCAAPLGDIMFLGGAGGLWAARWVGGAYVYTFSQINGVQGPRDLNCMVSMGDSAVMLTPNDVIVFDEATQASIATGRILRLVAQIFKAELMYVASTRQLIIAYGLQNETGLQHALIWDRDSNTWGKRDFTNTPLSCVNAVIIPVVQTPQTWANTPTTWANDTKAWNKTYRQERIYAGANGTAIYVASAATFNWYLERANMPAPDGNDIRVRSMELDAEAPEGTTIRMRMGSAEYSGALPTWGPIKSYLVGTDRLRHDDMQQGKYFSYQLAGEGSIRITSLRLYYNVRNKRP